MKSLLIASVMMCLCAICLAQSTASPGAPTEGPTGGLSAGPRGGPMSDARFAEHKQKMLARLAALTSCVQQAANPEQLRACRPNPPEK